MAAANSITLSLVLWLPVLALAASSAPVLQHHPRPGGGSRGSCPSCSAVFPQGQPAPIPGDFNFYFLVRQWPNEFCKIQKRDQCYIDPSPRNGFTLHGLWPNLDNACPEDFPEHCIVRGSSFEPLDMSSLNQTVLYGLQNNWISYTSSQECFLAHEWGCHGTCSGLSQEEYFATVLRLHAEHNLLDAMTAANLQPVGEVDRTDLLDAFEQRFGAGVRPLLQCKKQGGRFYLSEVWMCVDRSFNIVPCDDVCIKHPCRPIHPCGNTITFADNEFGLVSEPGPCQLGPCVPHTGTCKIP